MTSEGTTLDGGLDLVEVGRRLKDARRTRGLSLTEVATTAAVTEADLTRIEEGHAESLDLESLDHLAAALRVPLLQFFPERSAAARDREMSAEARWASFPASLRLFVEQERAAKRAVSEDIIRALAGITFHSREPGTPDDWRIVYRAFLRGLHPER